MADSTQSPEQPPPSGPRPKKRSGSDSLISFWVLVRPRVGPRRFVRDLINEILKDEVLDSAAVMAYFSMLAIFPAAILLLSLLPYLPIPNLEKAIFTALCHTMPLQAAELFTSTVTRAVSERHESLLSFSALGTIWAASSGLVSIMERVHSTYSGNDRRPFWKKRLIAIGLVFVVGILVVSAFSLVILGDMLHQRLSQAFGEHSLIFLLFPVLRWFTILVMLLGAISLVYYFGPDVEQRYRFITPGGILATVLSVVSSLGFRLYVANFGSYEATYGSLGAVIVLLLWLYVGALVLLVGAEVNGILERYAVQSRGVKPRKQPVKSPK